MRNKLIEAVEEYYNQGLDLVPLGNKEGSIYALPDWPKLPRTAPQELLAKFHWKYKRNPDAWAFRCGRPVDGKTDKFLVVVDGDAPGVFSELKELLPATRAHLGSKPGHLLFFVEQAIPSVCFDGKADLNGKKTRLIDLLSVGKMAIVPPSVHRATGKEYQVIDDLPIAEVKLSELMMAVEMVAEKHGWERPKPQELRTRSPDETLEAIKATVPLTRLGLKHGKQDCPLGGHETPGGHLIVSPDGRSWHCFGERHEINGGDVFSFVMARDRCTFPQAKAKLAELTGITLPAQPKIKDGKVMPKLALVSAPELLKREFGTRKWLVKDMIPAGGVSLLAGKRGVSKSWAAMHLGCAVSGGKMFFNHFETTQGPVIYFDAEMGEFTAWERMRMLGEAPEALNFAFYPPIRFDEGGFAILRDALADKPGAFVIVDCFSRFVGIEENDAPEMSRILTQFKALGEELGVTFLLLHHVRKGMPGAKGSQDKMDELRGSSELVNLADGVLVLERSRADPTSLILHHEKSRVGACLEPMQLKLELDDGKAVFSYIGTWKETEQQPEIAAKAIVKWAFNAGIRTFKTAEALAAARDLGFNKKAIDRGLKWAVNEHLLQKPEKGVYELPPEGLSTYETKGQMGQEGLSHD